MIIIQARLGSQRYPRKVLECKIDGLPMIDAVHRQCASTGLETYITMPAHDTELILHCQRRGYSYVPYSGDENDLIGRYRSAMERIQTDYCLRVTADCPYIFPQEILWLNRSGLRTDFCSNGWPDGRTTPDGVDCEYYSFKLIKWMDINVKNDTLREHLPVYIYEHADYLRKHGFILDRVDWPVNMSHIKFSVDESHDVLCHGRKLR